jgi:diguanylate cyclase (GGDEF)-like protein
VGAVLGLGAPFGLWLLILLGDPPDGSLMRWIYVYTGMATSLAFGTFGVIAGTLMKRVNASAIRDGLTELHNRRHVLAVMPRLASSARRRGRPLCVIMLDLDHFKRINDAYGHATGDRTLIAFADVIRDQVRSSDLAARWGGEEFLVVCPDADSQAGLEVAERLRASTEPLGPAELGHEQGQTVSLGVASYDPSSGPLDVDALLRHADAALYAAKNQGRNRVIEYGTLDASD